MSDRHKGLLKGVKTRFPNAHHLFCILHIIRNLRNLKGKRHSLWKAAEADSECEFIFHFKNFLLKCSKTQELYEHRGSWSRYAILEKCRRYGVRTNNWAEIQNNAMKFLRGGSVLTVLHKFFLFTSEKVREYHTRAETLYKSSSDLEDEGYTEYVTKILKKNNPDKHHKISWLCQMEVINGQ